MTISLRSENGAKIFLAFIFFKRNQEAEWGFVSFYTIFIIVIFYHES